MVSRRSLLAWLAVLAGCTGTGGSPSDADDPTETEPGDDPATAGPGSTADQDTTADQDDADGTATPTGTSDDLDLQEANVMAVEWDGSRGGEVEFSATLCHDDEG
jgi:hypothetical protein